MKGKGKRYNRLKKKANIFDAGGVTNIPGVGGLDLGSIGPLGSGGAAGTVAGTGDIVNTLSGGQKLQSLLGMGTGKLSGVSGIGGIANTVGNTVSTLINPSGNSTGVGDALQTVGGIASAIPGIGGLIGAGVGLVGGLVNAAFGSNINEEFVEQTRENTDAQRAITSDARDNASLLSDWSSYSDMAHVRRKDVGSDGWFRDKAKNLTKELNRNIDTANAIATQNLVRAGKNVDNTNDALIKGSYYALGGLIPDVSAINYDFANRKLFNDSIKAHNNNKVTGLPNYFNSTGIIGNLFSFGGDTTNLENAVDSLTEQNSRFTGSPSDIIAQWSANTGISNNDAFNLANTVNEYSDGGSIHIKPSKKGTFTAAAKKHGKSVQAFASQVLANKDNYSPAMVKKANFARNASKWKHADGGNLDVSYEEWRAGLPENLREEDGWYYNLRGAYEAGLSPELNKDGTYHLGSRNPETGEILKTPVHPTYLLGILNDESLGYFPQFRSGKTYTDTWKGNEMDYFKDGGALHTHGGIWSNGMTHINEGGRHEENPFEGVMFGTDSEGTPNLVEEGETVYNDYVFSNRLKVPKNLKKKYKLRGETYADVARNAGKESEERPNDPISRRGLDDIMQTLTYSQEEERMKKEMKKANRYSKGGKLGRLFDGTGSDSNWLYGTLLPNLPVEELEAMMNTGDAAPVADDTTVTGTVNKSDSSSGRTRGFNASYLRYAPAAMSGISALADVFSSPDYSAADRIAGIDIRPNLVHSTPVGQRLRYTPFDRNYYTNVLARNNAASRRALMNSSAGNRAAMFSGILANDARYNEGIGTLARQAAEYNDKLRQQVADFNRATDMFNSQQSMQAQTANAQARANATQQRLAQAEAVAKYRQAAKDAYDTRRSNNLNSFITNLGNIGLEDFTRNMINSNPALYYSLLNNGKVSYKGDSTRKNGGRLKKKRRTVYG